MASRSAIRTSSNRCSATTSTRARASPTGAAARSTSARSIMRSPTSPIWRRSSRSCSNRLKKTGRGGWLDEEMERLANPSSFAFEPEDAWKRLKLPSRNPAVLGRLKALAGWRETEARTKNLPRGRIVKDDTLGELAAHPPKTQDDLGRVRGLSAGLADERHRRPADGGARGGQAARAGRNARPRAAPARPDQGRGAGQRPA